MKNVFSFDAEGRQPYNNFIIKESDAEVVAKQDATLKAICAFEKKYSLPIYLKVIMYICAFVAAMVILGVLDAVIDGLPFAEAYGNARGSSTSAEPVSSFLSFCFAYPAILISKGRNRPNFKGLPKR